MNSTVDRQKELNEKIAAILVRLMITREQLQPWRRDDNEMLFGGSLSFGLWIYRRPDQTCYGMNYDTLDKLERGTIEEHAKRHNYTGDLNAMHEAENIMTREQKQDCWLRLCRKIVPFSEEAWRATALQRAEAFVKTMEAK